MHQVNLALLVLRLVFGLFLAYHGYNKVFGGGGLKGTAGWFGTIGMRWPAWQARLAAATEIGAGLMFAAGILTPLAAAGMIGLMTVAIVVAHWKVGFFIFKPNQGWEYCASIAVVAAIAAVITLVVGVIVGFRVHGGPVAAVGALALCIVFAASFSWLMIFLGLVSGSAQAAQGMSFSVFPLIFVSSAYVPVESMPGWLQPIANNQPVTAMVGAVRALVIGGDTEALLGHSTSWFVVRSLLWSIVILVVFASLSARRFARL